jgi:hypothetical protein
MSSSDIQVRIAKQLATIIQATKPNAKVWHYWCLSQGPIGESFPDMISPLEMEWSDAGNHPHAYVIGYEAFPRERVGNASFQDSFKFNLWGFYGFKKGNADKNSHDIFSVHCKDVQDAITKATKLQTTSDPNGVPEVNHHNEWDITKTGVFYMNANKVHIAQGTIDFYCKRTINLTPIT